MHPVPGSGIGVCVTRILPVAEKLSSPTSVPNQVTWNGSPVNSGRSDVKGRHVGCPQRFNVSATSIDAILISSVTNALNRRAVATISPDGTCNTRSPSTLIVSPSPPTSKTSPSTPCVAKSLRSVSSTRSSIGPPGTAAPKSLQGLMHAVSAWAGDTSRKLPATRARNSVASFLSMPYEWYGGASCGGTAGPLGAAYTASPRNRNSTGEPPLGRLSRRFQKKSPRNPGCLALWMLLCGCRFVDVALWMWLCRYRFVDAACAT